MSDLRAARSAAQQVGWAEVDASMEEVAEAIAADGGEVFAVAGGDGPVDTLRPSDVPSARRRSLSGRYGLGNFPLHTDGAHLRYPPTVVILRLDSKASTTPTSLHPVSLSRVRADLRAALTRGIFQVDVGRRAF